MTSPTFANEEMADKTSLSNSKIRIVGVMFEQCPASVIVSAQSFNFTLLLCNG